MEHIPEHARRWGTRRGILFLGMVRCQARMHIKALIQNPKEVTRIAEHLGVVPWRAPPPFASPSLYNAA